MAEVRVTQRFASENEIETRVEAPRLFIQQTGTVRFDHQKGFASLTLGDWQLSRKVNAA
jgi:hypothetical protein